MTYAVLGWWEKRSMIQLIRKNLVAHKKRNKLTALIYALTIGCTIFLIVAANLQINSVEQLSSGYAYDATIGVDAHDRFPYTSLIHPK